MNLKQKLENAGVRLFSINDLRDRKNLSIVPQSSNLYAIETIIKDDNNRYGMDLDQKCILPVLHDRNLKPGTQKVRGLDMNDPRDVILYRIASSVTLIHDVPVTISSILTGRDLYESRDQLIRLTGIENRLLVSKQLKQVDIITGFKLSRNEMYYLITGNDGCQPLRYCLWATQVSVKADDLADAVDWERIYLPSTNLEIGGKTVAVVHDSYHHEDYELKLENDPAHRAEIDAANAQLSEESKQLIRILPEDYITISFADFVAAYEDKYK